MLRDFSVELRYVIPIALAVIALAGAGYAVGSTVGSGVGTTTALVKTVTIIHQVPGKTVRQEPLVKTIRETAKVKTVRSGTTTVRSRQVVAVPASVNALTSIKTVRVPRTLTATTTQVSTVVSVTTVTETATKTHPPHP